MRPLTATALLATLCSLVACGEGTGTLVLLLESNVPLVGLAHFHVTVTEGTSRAVADLSPGAPVALGSLEMQSLALVTPRGQSGPILIVVDAFDATSTRVASGSATAEQRAGSTVTVPVHLGNPSGMPATDAGPTIDAAPATDTGPKTDMTPAMDAAPTTDMTPARDAAPTTDMAPMTDLVPPARDLAPPPSPDLTVPVQMMPGPVYCTGKAIDSLCGQNDCPMGYKGQCKCEMSPSGQICIPTCASAADCPMELGVCMGGFCHPSMMDGGMS